MSLTNLIRDQIIIIDDHKRGNRESKHFDNTQNDVHIDKETNYPIDGKRQKIKIRIPINSERPIKIESNRKSISIPRKLKKEITEAFENKDIRQRFIGDVLETLANFDSILSSEEKAQSVLSRLSKHFDLNWDNETISKYKDEILQAYTQFYIDKSGRKYFLKLDREQIVIGENSGYPRQFKTYNP
ncbi:hypothetical protein QEG73_14945 [Chitinophagaceae bacterium 26-R-25]|nr:hypothetical protein [Chitinophagaceae bacterium 26-R-25]